MNQINNNVCVNPDCGKLVNEQNPARKIMYGKIGTCESCHEQAQQKRERGYIRIVPSGGGISIAEAKRLEKLAYERSEKK